MRPGRITRRAQAEYLAIYRAWLARQLHDVDHEPMRAETRATSELRTQLEECGPEHGRETATGLVVYRGPPPLRLRLVVEPGTGDVVSVLPQHEKDRTR